MTKKDFFRVIFKLFGAYLLLTSASSSVPMSYVQLKFLLVSDGEDKFSAVPFILLITAFFGTMIWLLIFKTDYLIRIFRFDKGFDDENVSLGQLTNENIVKISVILIGGYVMFQKMPNLVIDATIWFANKVSSKEQEYGPDLIRRWWTNFLIFIGGYLLMTNYRFIPRLLKINNDRVDEKS